MRRRTNMAQPKGKGAKKADIAAQEKIVAQFEQMRQEQRAVASKIAELESDKNEHNLVIGALKKVDPGRRCFRMVGGVLVERTVKDVLPALEHNIEQLSVITAKLTEQLQQKGKELNEFREKHGIRFVEEKDKDADKSAESSKSTTSQGVLVDT